MSNTAPIPKTRRGVAKQITGLPKNRYQKFRRACLLLGARSVSSHLDTLVRQTIVEAERQFGDLFAVLTPDEADVQAAVASGACRVQQVSEETGLSLSRAEILLDELASRGVLRKSRAIKTTEQARGATVWEYFAK